MLSKKAVKILRYLNRSGDWYYQSQLEKDISGFDYLAFKALVDNGYLARVVDENELPEYDEYGRTYYPEQFGISDKGRAYLEGRASQRWADARSWIAIGISALSLLVAIIALLA